jgi:tRNA (adenine22-N1)-methyltransferase
LTKRLAACAAWVTEGGIACDVGTDHAYLAAELLRTGRCTKVIAADIGEGPLAAARRTLSQAGLLDRAQLVLSDGLTRIPPDGITDVIIAGMGGETMVHILAACDWVQNGVQLILQPMTKAPVLRQWLSAHGFCCLQEQVVQEGRFFYPVMQLRYDGKERCLSPLEQALGTLDWTSETVQRYGNFRLQHYEQLAQQMAQAQPAAAAQYRALAAAIREKQRTQEESI